MGSSYQEQAIVHRLKMKRIVADIYYLKDENSKMALFNLKKTYREISRPFWMNDQSIVKERANRMERQRLTVFLWTEEHYKKQRSCIWDYSAFENRMMDLY